MSEQNRETSLAGLLDIIRMTNSDKTMVALGLDLTTLGLNLSSLDPLNSTFISPYASLPSSGSEPAFTLPKCYTSFPPQIPLSKMQVFSDETLFYIFYSFPRDVLQEASAQVLHSRGWRFHKELQLWLMKDSLSSDVKTNGIERGVFIFFDVHNWIKVKKDFVLNYEMIEEREDAQV